jgi:ribosome-associated protein
VTPEAVRDLALQALEDMKAVDVRVLDVHAMTSIMDYMIVASGTSDRHVRSLVNAVVEKAKEKDMRPLGVEGEQHAQWALVDLGDVVVHVMRPEVRDFYQLEKLWSFQEHKGAGKA